MPAAAGPNAFALFAFALRESDWELAELIARMLVADRGGRLRLEAALAGRSRRPGAPPTLESLALWARVSRALELEPG